MLRFLKVHEMPLSCVFNRFRETGTLPSLSDQLVHMNRNVMCLRAPVRSRCLSVLKVHAAMSMLFLIFAIYIIFESREKLLVSVVISLPVLFQLLGCYRIWQVKKNSNYYFFRDEGSVVFSVLFRTHTVEWRSVRGAHINFNQGGGGYTIAPEYGLALATPSEDGNYHPKNAIWIASNDPDNDHLEPVASVWEYIRQYMEHGPDNLPPPSEPDAWKSPRHQTYLTPSEAWQHYMPRGEWKHPVNMLHVVAMPFHLFVAVSWYATCRLFRVPKEPPVPEAVKRLLDAQNTSTSTVIK